MMYHNLNQRFNSPTINLAIGASDFDRFVKNLKGYVDAELIESQEKKKYPIGELTYDGNTIKVHFIHYETFAEAKEKWDQRKERINYSNLYIVQHAPFRINKDFFEDFMSIPYKHKLLITYPTRFKNEYIATPLAMCMIWRCPSKILEYKSRFSVRRYMDHVDYVKFLNQN